MDKIDRTFSPDQDFFENVSRAAFANPFGETRDNLDRNIGGAGVDSSGTEIIQAVVDRVARVIEEMRRKSIADLQGFDGSRKEIIRRVFLFHVFHRYTNQFDELIQVQLKNGDAPCRVYFSDKVLTELHALGFADADCLRYFAVFYQLRRAYYFIRTGLIGNAPSMKALRKHLWNCVFTHDMSWFESHLWDRMEDFSILLLGETGTGKGSAAAAIGRSGFIPFDPDKKCFTESFTRNFVAINLSQYSEGVLESELFGHRKGAFTGAVDNHEGLFSRCAPHGVIFLDEIGDSGIPVQIKLLQVLQERLFFPVGSHEAKRFSGRIVAATNRQLADLRQRNKFRDDLYFRLCSDEVVLPTLRQRLQEDPRELDLLIESILIRLYGDSSSARIKSLRDILVRDVGADYQWPGNVRELQQAVKRVILTGRYRGDQALKKSEVSGADSLTSGIKDARFDKESLMAEYSAFLYERFGTYEEVARVTKLDRRTAKKYVHIGLKRP
jgi:transcriptional regulator with AAA-type ATPase domain